MGKLGLLFSKQMLVIASGLMFTGVAFASSGASSLIAGHTSNGVGSKVPDVQKVEEATVSGVLGASNQNQTQDSVQQVSQNQVTDSTFTASQPVAQDSTVQDSLNSGAALSSSAIVESNPVAPDPTITNTPAPIPSATPTARKASLNSSPSPSPVSSVKIPLGTSVPREAESETESDRRTQMNEVIRSARSDEED